MRSATAWLVGVSIGVTACGGGNSTPTQPSTPPAPTVTGLVIGGGSGPLRTGQSVTLNATVNLSNNTTQAATSPAWTSSNTTVASVDNAGVVTANNQGSATISVSAQGQTASMPVTVWQDYQGTWIGQYRIRVCTATGDFSAIGWCSSDFFNVGKLLPVRVIFTQTSSPAVNGTIELGTIVGNLRGNVFDNRHFVGSGTASFSSEGIVLTFTIGTFDALASGTQMAGSFVWNVGATGAAGQGYNELDLVGVTRTSGLTTSVRRTAPSVRTIPELFDAMMTTPE